MSQQVNLYQPIFRKQQKVFSAATMVKIAVVLVIGFGAIYSFGRLQLDKLETHAAQLEQQRDNATVQLTRVTGEREPARRSELLQQQLEQAGAELARKQRQLMVLERRARVDATGFSEYFAGLGRQRVNGLWLTRIAVREDGHVRLQGNTEQARLVPRYLQRLSNEQAFRGTEFHSIRIERADVPAYNTFSVSTARGEDS